MSRIALVADTQRLGGGEGMLVEMARAGVEAGHDVVVMAPEEWLLEHVSAKVPGVRVERVGSEWLLAPSRARRALALARSLVALAGALRRLRPDILHSSNGGHPGSLLCCLALPLARLLRIRRRVYSVHAAPRPRGTVNATLERILDRMVWGSAHGVAVASRYTGDRLCELRGMPDRLRRSVPNAVPEPAAGVAAAALREELRAPGGLLAGMVAASSDEQKGHAVLLEAIRRAPDAVHAVVAGSDFPPSVAEAARTLAGEGRLRMLGRVDEVGSVLAALDVLVVPSVADESIPLVIPEAMAAGVPVFASRLSGIPEAVADGETGRLFPPGDAAALAELLRDAAAGALPLAAWGRAARELWRERFSSEALAAATLALYERAEDER